MTPAVILGAVRTPIGKFQGALRSKSASDLGAVAIREVVRRAEVPTGDVEEVIFGNVLGAGLGQGPSRRAALMAGLPHAVPATTLSKVCGSGLRAVMGAAQSIACGDSQLVIAGGMESMSNAPHLLGRARSGYRLGHGELIDVILRDGLICSTLGLHMGEIADRCARTYRISRAEQDAFAVESYRRARRAIEDGAFKREIASVEVGGMVPSATVARDEQPFADDIEKLLALKPAFEDEGTVTAGNASSLNDGAAALVIAAEGYTRRKPLARIVGYASAAQAPEDFATAPIHAIRSVLEKAGLHARDIDLFEINQAFSVASIVVSRILEIDASRVDVHGGAVALGHPIGASGARILVTLLHAMQRREARRGIAAICIGGGEAVAMLVERP
ncbi:MAG: thiolase family protein [Polyangiales bacterium]